MMRYMLTPRETPVSWLCAVIVGVAISDGLTAIAIIAFLTGWAANLAGKTLMAREQAEEVDP